MILSTYTMIARLFTLAAVRLRSDRGDLNTQWVIGVTVAVIIAFALGAAFFTEATGVANNVDMQFTAPN
jgi:hypothetical protein